MNRSHPITSHDAMAHHMIRQTLAGLCLAGDDLEAAYAAVLKIMTTSPAKHNPYYAFAVHCGAYRPGTIIEGVQYGRTDPAAPPRANAKSLLERALDKAKENTNE